MSQLSNGSAMGVGFRFLQERSKEGGKQYRGGCVATGVCWAHRSCAGPCDGAPRMGVVGGASPGSCALLRLSCGLCPHRVISTLLPPPRPGSGDRLVLAFSYC